MIQLYQVSQNTNSWVINSSFWKKLITDSTTDLEVERDSSKRFEGVRSLDIRLRYCMLKSFHLGWKKMFEFLHLIYIMWVMGVRCDALTRHPVLGNGVTNLRTITC